MNSNEPVWTHLLKEGPKPSRFGCLGFAATVLGVAGFLVTGLVIR